jgi:hypothetical protein
MDKSLPIRCPPVQYPCPSCTGELIWNTVKLDLVHTRLFTNGHLSKNQNHWVCWPCPSSAILENTVSRNHGLGLALSRGLNKECVRFEVFAAVTMKNGVFWHITPCDLVRTDVSEELSASIIRVIRIGELGTTLAVTSNRSTLRRNTICRFLQEPYGVISQKTPFFNKECVSFLSTEDGNRPSFRSVVISSYLEIRTMDKVHKPSDSECYTPSSESFIF